MGIQSLGRWRSPILTILIADHNEDVLNILKEQLLATNYALLYAQNGEEAIAFLDRVKSKVALAIIDLELPDLSGWDLIGRLTIHDRKLQDCAIRSNGGVRRLSKPVPPEASASTGLAAVLQPLSESQGASARCLA